MTQHAFAVYENGYLIPTAPLEGVPEHALVHIVYESDTPLSVDEQLAILRAVSVNEELADAIEAGRKTGWNVEEF